MYLLKPTTLARIASVFLSRLSSFLEWRDGEVSLFGWMPNAEAASSVVYFARSGWAHSFVFLASLWLRDDLAETLSCLCLYGNQHRASAKGALKIVLTDRRLDPSSLPSGCQETRLHVFETDAIGGETVFFEKSLHACSKYKVLDSFPVLSTEAQGPGCSSRTLSPPFSSLFPRASCS